MSDRNKPRDSDEKAMSPLEFVEAVKQATSDAAVAGTIESLEKPSGRKPAKELLKLSTWYQKLSDRDRDSLRDALRRAAEMAVFEFFCVLDGVSAIEDGPNKGELQLYLTKADGSVRLNPPSESLHDLFNLQCAERQPATEQS